MEIETILHSGAQVEITRFAGPFAPGRYRLRHERLDAWSIISMKTGLDYATHRDQLRDMINANALQKIDPNQIAKEAQIIALRLASPIRPLDRTSAPVDGLALFDAVRSPCML
jgi:hypothetical protein